MGMTASMNHQPMALGGMGGFQQQQQQQQQHGNQGLGMGMGMGMGMNSMTPARPANTGMGMMSPMQPLQPMGGSQVGGVKQQNKGKNSDLGMFDPFS